MEINNAFELYRVLDKLSPDMEWNALYKRKQCKAPFIMNNRLADKAVVDFFTTHSISSAVEFACGEGRNAVFVASSCADVLAIDSSSMALEVRVTLSKILGAPALHSTHCGTVTACSFPKEETLQTRQYVSAAQIIASDKTVFARRTFDNGEGLTAANITWNVEKRRRISELPDACWIPDLPTS